MSNTKNSNFINLQVKSTNDAGYKNQETIGACTPKGTIQEDGTAQRNHTAFINLEKLIELTAKGEIDRGDYLNCALSENKHFTGENGIHTVLDGQVPVTTATDNTSSSDYVKVRVKSKNEAGYHNEVIIGNITKKGTPLKNGTPAFADLMSINLATVRDLVKSGEIPSKYLNLIIIPNKKCAHNYVVSQAVAPSTPNKVAQQQAASAAPMDDIPF